MSAAANEQTMNETIRTQTTTFPFLSMTHRNATLKIVIKRELLQHQRHTN
jgi:hypothetical protein